MKFYITKGLSMKSLPLTLASLLSVSLLLIGCNNSKPKAIISNDAYQQVNNSNKFPQARRNPNEVVCVNCRSKFKLSSAQHKQHNGHEYIECPICHHDYLKKGKD